MKPKYLLIVILVSISLKGHSLFYYLGETESSIRKDFPKSTKLNLTYDNAGNKMLWWIELDPDMDLDEYIIIRFTAGISTSTTILPRTNKALDHRLDSFNRTCKHSDSNEWDCNEYGEKFHMSSVTMKSPDNKSNFIGVTITPIY